MLLNILIGKAGILERVPIIGEPMETALLDNEAAVDVSNSLSVFDLDFGKHMLMLCTQLVATNLSDISPEFQTEIDAQFKSLSDSFKATIARYQSIASGQGFA